MQIYQESTQTRDYQWTSLGNHENDKNPENSFIRQIPGLWFKRDSEYVFDRSEYHISE